MATEGFGQDLHKALALLDHPPPGQGLSVSGRVFLCAQHPMATGGDTQGHCATLAPLAAAWGRLCLLLLGLELFSPLRR